MAAVGGSMSGGLHSSAIERGDHAVFQFPISIRPLRNRHPRRTLGAFTGSVVTGKVDSLGEALAAWKNVGLGLPRQAPRPSQHVVDFLNQLAAFCYCFY